MTGIRSHIFCPSSGIEENQLLFFCFLCPTDLSQLTLDRSYQTHSFITECFYQLTYFILLTYQLTDYPGSFF